MVAIEPTTLWIPGCTWRHRTDNSRNFVYINYTSFSARNWEVMNQSLSQAFTESILCRVHWQPPTFRMFIVPSTSIKELGSMLRNGGIYKFSNTIVIISNFAFQKINCSSFAVSPHSAVWRQKAGLLPKISHYSTPHTFRITRACIKPRPPLRSVHYTPYWKITQTAAAINGIWGMCNAVLQFMRILQ